MEANAHLGRLILELNAKVREIDGYFLSPRVSSLSLSPLYSSLTSRIEDGGESKANKKHKERKIKESVFYLLLGPLTQESGPHPTKKRLKDEPPVWLEKVFGSNLKCYTLPFKF